jgi:hypothetical protein
MKKFILIITKLAKTSFIVSMGLALFYADNSFKRLSFRNNFEADLSIFYLLPK